MEKKRIALWASMMVSIALLISIMVLAGNESFAWPIGGRATIPTYEISFSSQKNKFHNNGGSVGYDGDATIQTELGNDVGFSYHAIIGGGSSTWHVMKESGDFYNTDPIHGLDSISLTFKTNAKSFDILYSRDKSFDHSGSFTSSTSEPIIFDFDEYAPNYFKVINTSGSNLNVASVNIALTCENAFPYITLSSEDNEMGTVM